MGVAKKTRKFGAVKRMIGQRDARLKKNQDKGEIEGKKKEKGADVVREIPQVSSALFFQVSWYCHLRRRTLLTDMIVQYCLSKLVNARDSRQLLSKL